MTASLAEERVLESTVAFIVNLDEYDEGVNVGIVRYTRGTIVLFTLMYEAAEIAELCVPIFVILTINLYDPAERRPVRFNVELF